MHRLPFRPDRQGHGSFRADCVMFLQYTSLATKGALVVNPMSSIIRSAASRLTDSVWSATAKRLRSGEGPSRALDVIPRGRHLPPINPECCRGLDQGPGARRGSDGIARVCETG